MDINSVVRLNDGRTSYQVKETMDEISDELYDINYPYDPGFIKLTDHAVGSVLINVSNIVSVTNYDNSL